MIAGIVGDVIGSVYEAYQWQHLNQDLIRPLPFSFTRLKKESIENQISSTDIQEDPAILFLFKENTKWVRNQYHWTDDTLCTLALYSAYIHKTDPVQTMVSMCKKYADEATGFGKSFSAWLDNPVPYQSFANGAIMRIGFIPYLPISLNDKIQLGMNYTKISHNHPDSYQSVSDYILLCHMLDEDETKYGEKKSIRSILEKYEYTKTVEDLHQERKFELNALQTFLQSCVIVLESNSMEEVLKKSFYVGGDSDTLACIAANIASHIYDCSLELEVLAEKTLDPYPELYKLVTHFKEHYTPKNQFKKVF